MSANIKYKYKTAGIDRDVDESISDFVHARLTNKNLNEKLGKLVELLVERGVLSRREVFDVFKRTEDYLG